MEKEKKKLSPKAKRIINIVVDVVVAVILAFALILAISTIVSKKKGYDQYTEIFGSAYLAVESDSMVPTFEKGDLIKIKMVKGNDAANLDKGDIITFKSTRVTADGKTVLNTHRIVKVNKVNGKVVSYVTKGDGNDNEDASSVLVDEVVGIYKGKAGGIGKVFLFMQTSAGFFVCVVLPTLLIVAYCAVNLVLVIRKEKKKQTEEAVVAKLDERERIRQELLAEMQANAGETSQSGEPEQTETTADEQSETPAPEPVNEPETETEQQTSETEESSADEEEK